MKIKTTLAICLSAAFAFKAGAQTKAEYKARIDTLYSGVQQHLYDAAAGLYYEDTKPESKKRHSYLWPLCALVQGADEMDKLEPKKNRIDSVLAAIQKYYRPTAPAPGYQAMVVHDEKDSRFYDDNQWIGIAGLDAYNRTHNKKYLELGKLIHRFQLTAYDDKAGGGLYWKEDERTTKNTCSNGPAVLIALQLYKITKEKKYLDTALLIYNWTNKNLQAPSGVFYDNIKIPSLNVDKATYTYNSGTMLQANVLLYTITKDKKYLTEAKRIADASKAHFYCNGRLPGNYWFNAVLIRGYVELYQVEKDKSRLQFIIDDANAIWKTEREGNLIGKKKEKALIDQGAMIEIYGRLASLK
ncbi:glycoside hydrolase [Mucilaginibacter sp. JRF]|uniref:glycoside hydrolase family 76 protein n=1 Tax=Mucilaginibacter sp. JRF TaxID=2780088 RepID=UPI00187F25BA|nr:glycoside hydrolase family 76 protein [Mucilaginibacter sp. JRF]MBE9585957.1 glycoside hydrolase [Mucilaginibacter sp. JRF]